MQNLQYLVSTESEFGDMLWAAGNDTKPEDFLRFINRQHIMQTAKRFVLGCELELFGPEDPSTIFLDGIGERHEVNQWCDLLTIHRSHAETLLRQYLLARRVTWEAEQECFDEGIWIRRYNHDAYALATLFSSTQKTAVAIAYAYLASLEPAYGAAPIIYNGHEVMSQIEWANQFLFNGDGPVGWPKEWSEVLLLKGFHALMLEEPRGY